MESRVRRSALAARGWRPLAWGLLALVVALGRGAAAQERGFALQRYDGATVGSSLFLLERPWYSSQRFGAVGLTLDYARNPLVPRLATGRDALAPLVSTALVGHLDLAGSLFDRVLVSASLPVTLLETGSTEPVSQVAPLTGLGIGDPRVGVMVRVAGQAEHDAISLHLGATAWLPLGGPATHQGDVGLRLMPRAVLAGAFADVGRWTLDAAFLYRPYASFGPPALGLTAASEARVGLALGASLFDGRLSLGPEARFAVQVVGENAFAVNGMNLELLGGLQYLFFDQVLLGVAGGSAFFGAAGTPDARAVVRLAWAPRRQRVGDGPPERRTTPVDPCGDGGCRAAELDDPDGDGIPTEADRCPFEPETKNGIRDDDGCPEFELERGSVLARVLAPQANPPPRLAPSPPAGAPALTLTRDAGPTPLSTVRPEETPRPALTLAGEPDAGVDRAAAFATADSDGDGVVDEVDRCPATPEDLDGFEDEDGCPELDNDRDGVPDAIDACPLVAETPNGFQDDDGCPDVAPDADGDGIADLADRCPFEPETRNGVRDDDGCPEHETPVTAALAQLLAATTAPSLLVPPRLDALTAGPRRPPDSDGDGIDDEADRCPVSPEDLDGFEDDDGCPELDNDLDGIPDAMDRCPLDAETFNGWQDEDGCPDEPQDVDGDGIAYDADRCPLEPGVAPDGCPRAPLPVLALPGFPAFPGAPKSTPEPGVAGAPTPAVADLDGDGVPDDEDRCPMSPEDLDGFEDDDGCPELDNDLDGIPDTADKCPFAAETINGVKDDDGCPDVGASKVSIQAGAVVIDGVVRFKTGSATLQAASLPLLKQVASTLRAAASLSVEIRGHTDDVGSAAQNVRLSKRRADAIRAVLIKAGVAPTRLITSGYGPTRPVATNKTPAGREQNRRVEFLILGETK